MSRTADYLDWLMRDAGLVELCQVDGRKLDVGWYDKADALLHDARTMARTGNLFTTLNRIDPDGLRAYLAARREGDPDKILRTPDEVVTRFARLFFDFDPERPKDTSSTDGELAEAEARARGLARRLGALGWPAPAIAMSGNGWHLQYRTALPNNAETKAQLKAIYDGLHGEFSDDVVTFDRSVRNPARLCALYGSVKRKGPSTPERPHRKSIVQIPRDWQQVHPRQVAALADHFARQAPQRPLEPHRSPAERFTGSGRGDYARLDVVAWFTAHGLYRGHIRDHVHAVACPWSDEHTTTSPPGDTVIFEADGGWPGFDCKHAHCSGRTIRDVLALWGDADQFCAADFERRAA